MDFFEKNNLLQPITKLDLTDYQKILLKFCSNITGSKSYIQLYNHWVTVLLPDKIEKLSFTNDDDILFTFKLEYYTLPKNLPEQNRLFNQPYKSDVYISIKTEGETKKIFKLGDVPVMLGSVLCLLIKNNNLSTGYRKQLNHQYFSIDDKFTQLVNDDDLILKGECISDPFGYFIISSERSLVTQEKDVMHAIDWWYLKMVPEKEYNGDDVKWFKLKYEDWKQAFKVASNNGMVIFM